MLIGLGSIYSFMTTYRESLKSAEEMCLTPDHSNVDIEKLKV